MAVEFTEKEFLKKLESNKKLFLRKSGEASVNDAAANSHVKTGLSRNSKRFDFIDGNSIEVIAPLDYDVYLERRFAIMKLSLLRVKNQLDEIAKRIFKT